VTASPARQFPNRHNGNQPTPSSLHYLDTTLLHYSLERAFFCAKSPFVFNNFQHTNLQVLSFDIDTTYPQGGGEANTRRRCGSTARSLFYTDGLLQVGQLKEGMCT
jgi:hypothetical protein